MNQFTGVCGGGPVFDDHFPRWVGPFSTDITRSLSDPNEKAYYLCRFARGTTAEELVSVAGCRWGIETCFEQSKGEVGLDDYKVPSWEGWHHHITLAMLADAFLVVIRTQAAKTDRKKSDDFLN